MKNLNFGQIFGTVRIDDLNFNTEPQAASLRIPEGALTTDFGNSFRFIHNNRGKVLYCNELSRWAIWSGSYWAMDTCGRILRIGAETILNIMQEASGEPTHDVKTDLIRWSKQCQKPERVNAMLKFAAPEMAISWSTMDTDTFLLNVQNGTVDLHTGELLPHNPVHMNSKIAPIEYDPEARCPRLISFLESAFPDAPEMIHYMQKVIGYILTGDTKEKCFFIFWGPGGNNGKSVLINVLRFILGPYALQTPVSTLQNKRPGGNSNDIVRLKGARFVAASEIDPNQRYTFDEALLKMLTGNDPVAARELFKEFIEYYPEFKLFIGTNHLPKLNTKDTALMDRVMTIPFRQSFPRDHANRDDNLLNQLKAEASGILNWAIEGCLMWQREGLGAVPDDVAIEVVTDERLAAIDRFIQESCNFNEGLKQKCGDLYKAYVAWCSANETLPVGNGVFSRHIKGRYNLSSGKVGSAGVHWFGISLNDSIPAVTAA